MAAPGRQLPAGRRNCTAVRYPVPLRSPMLSQPTRPDACSLKPRPHPQRSHLSKVAAPWPVLIAQPHRKQTVEELAAQQASGTDPGGALGGLDPGPKHVPATGVWVGRLTGVGWMNILDRLGLCSIRPANPRQGAL